ncbi:MAG TPA: endo-1,4-beta-xylanase, partial [Vicinamibacteria bacterium]
MPRLLPAYAAPATLGMLLAGCGGARPTPTAPASPTAPGATQVEPLRGAASAGSRLIGAAVTSRLLREEATYRDAFAHHFNYVTAEYEMKWGQIERQPGQRN